MELIRLLDLRGQQLSEAEVAKILPRADFDIQKAAESVAPLLERVRTGGSKALREITLEFDGFDPDPIVVSGAELRSALSGLDGKLREAIEISIDRVRQVSEKSLPKDFSVSFGADSKVSQRYLPVDSVGLYAPGGKAVYPSSVVMNAVPAQVAKVPLISLATPGQKAFGGRPHPTVLATCALLGVENVYNMGGAAAIAAFGYGVADLELNAVRTITGPGNIYVAAAKRLLRGRVGIDSEAGTTEILIIADESANPAFVAADLISQAEHDEAAAAILITHSQKLIDAVSLELKLQVDQTTHSQRVRAALGGVQSALVFVDSIRQAIEISNHYATEHLEIQTKNPTEVATHITNAGAIFIGDYSPVSLGDYLAGSNHVLPTGGAAKLGPGLGVHSFLRAQQLIEYGAEGLAEISNSLVNFADAEALPAHGSAVNRRFRDL